MLSLSPRGTSHLLLHSALAASLGAVLWAPAAQAADLTGHWRGPSNVKYEIVQTGNAVTLNVVDSTRVSEGSIDGSNVELVSTDPMFPESYSLVLSGDELTLSGVLHTIGCAFSLCYAVDIQMVLERCACFDGNSANGDGCDLMCSVEVCHECTGDPSTCTVVADATACEDPSFCVSGGTCTEGTCGGGVETAQCIDLSGTWLRALRGTSDLYTGSSTSRSEFVQDSDGNLSVFSLPSGYRQTTGTFDASTFALHVNGTGSWPNCGLAALNGAVAAEGNRYTATGGYLSATLRGCFGYAPYDEFGVRCAPAALEPSDGCSVDSCQRCQGDPPVCEPVPDWTPCHSDDPCAVVSTCQSGECSTTLSQYCPACSVCDGAGGCMVGPRNDCRAARTKIAIKSLEAGAKSSLHWNWRNGGEVQPYEIAHPDVSSEVAICLFDESGSTPVLLYSDSVNEYGLDPGWSVHSSGSMRFRSRSDAISAIDLRVGESARMGMKTDGEALGLPMPALSLPLRTQLQVVDGSCFEGTYNADDAGRNENGVFKASSAP